MADLGIELLTPESALVQGAATGVVLRTSEGDLTVLAGHADLVGDVVPGVVRVERGDEVERIVVHGGFVQVKTDHGAAADLLEVDAHEWTTRVTVLAGVAERLETLDVARAEAAKERAAAALASLAADDADAAERSSHEAALARAELRLSAAAERAVSGA